MRAIHHYGRVRVEFETPPGKLDLVFDLLAEYSAMIFDRDERRFTLTFEDTDDADDFLRELFGRRVAPGLPGLKRSRRVEGDTEQVFIG